MMEVVHENKVEPSDSVFCKFGQLSCIAGNTSHMSSLSPQKVFAGSERYSFHRLAYKLFRHFICFTTCYLFRPSKPSSPFVQFWTNPTRRFMGWKSLKMDSLSLNQGRGGDCFHHVGLFWSKSGLFFKRFPFWQGVQVKINSHFS